MPVIIRTSDRGMFKSCRRKWDLASKMRQDYEPLANAKPLEFGTAIHAALDSYYDPRTYKLLTRTERTSLAIVAFEDAQTEQKNLRKKLSGQESLNEEDMIDFTERSLLGAGMLRNYTDYWIDDFFEVMAVEIEFEVDIPGLDGYVYQGRVDAIVKDKNGFYWIVDHKTRGQFGSIEHYDMDEQATSYAWAIQHVLGIKIHGIIFNELLKSAPKRPEFLKNGGLSKNKQQRTTYSLYMRALEENNIAPHDYADFLEYLKGQENPFFRRIPIYRSQRELENQGKQIVLEALDMTNDPSIYPAPSMFNCMGCAYKSPCLALQEGSDAQWILDAQYQKRTV